MLYANSTEARTAHIHALTATHHIFLLYFREEELKMVLRGDFIPPLCTLSQLARLCSNIRFSSERRTLEHSSSGVIK